MNIPVIGSLNGTTNGGWTKYAEADQEAGADALELNVYLIATDPQESGELIEKRTIELCREVVAQRRYSGGGEALAVLYVAVAFRDATRRGRH